MLKLESPFYRSTMTVSRSGNLAVFDVETEAAESERGFDPQTFQFGNEVFQLVTVNELARAYYGEDTGYVLAPITGLAVAISDPRGRPFNEDTYPGWELIELKPTVSGRFEVVFSFDGGASYALWIVGADGKFMFGKLYDTLAEVESEFQDDLDGDGEFAGSDAQFGLVALGESSTLFYNRANDGLVISDNGSASYYAVTFNGQSVTRDFIAGWQVQGFVDAANGEGYQLAWYNPTTNKVAVWQLDFLGRYIDKSVIIHDDPRSMEYIFDTDFDGDSAVGLRELSSKENNGDARLFANEVSATENNYTVFTPTDGMVALFFQGKAINASTVPTWDMVQIETSEEGYLGLWKKNGEEKYALWSFDETGNYISGSAEFLTDTTLIEPIFDADINNDGEIGPDPVNVRRIDENGDVILSTITSLDTYAISVGNEGRVIEVKLNGQPVTATTFPGLELIQAEETESGFILLWQSFQTGALNIWELDSEGNYIPGSSRSDVDGRLYEPLFESEIIFGREFGVRTSAAEDNGEVSLFVDENLENYIQVQGDNAQIAVTYNGAIVRDGDFGSYLLSQVEETETGFKALWIDADAGKYLTWDLDAEGAFVAGSVEFISDPRLVEVFFAADLDADGARGPAFSISKGEVAGDVWLRQNAVDGGYLLQDDRGSIIKEVTFNGAAVTFQTFNGYEMIQAEEKGDGYQVLFSFQNGQSFTIWDLDSDGAYIAGTARTVNQPIDVIQDIFQADLLDEFGVGN